MGDGCVYTHADGRIIAHLPTGRDGDFEAALRATGHDFRRVEHSALSSKRPPMTAIVRSDVVEQEDGSRVHRRYFHTTDNARLIFHSERVDTPAAQDDAFDDVAPSTQPKEARF